MNYYVKTYFILLLILIIFFIIEQFAPEFSDLPVSCKKRNETQNGKTLPPDFHAPWMVTIRTKDLLRSRCDGVLITPQWVLTVASCLFHQTLSRLEIVANTISESQNVEASFLHPEYKPNSHTNDIALLKTESSFTLSVKMLPICPQKTDDVNMFCKDNCQVSPTMFAASPKSISMMEIESCKRIYQHSGMDDMVNKASICVNSSDYPAARSFMGSGCIGNLGTSLTCLKETGGRVLTGILSLGWSCANSISPAIFTNVQKHYLWISKVIQSKSEVDVEECSNSLTGWFVKVYKENLLMRHINYILSEKYFGIEPKFNKYVKSRTFQPDGSDTDNDIDTKNDRVEDQNKDRSNNKITYFIPKEDGLHMYISIPKKNS